MRLAVLAAADPLNVKTWSGTPYFMTKALQAGFRDVLPVRTPRPVWHAYMRRGLRRATGGRIDVFWSPSLARWTADRLADRIKAEGADVAVCIGNAPLSAFLAKRMPTVHVSDATVPLMLDYYSEFSRLPKALARSAWRLDMASVLGARACLFSTGWAAASAVKDYGADPARVVCIPWGANIDPQQVAADAADAEEDVCHLVFIGVDWERKGGDIAVGAARRLVADGRAAKLHIIGATPKLQERTDSIVVHGFIDKGTAEGRALFDRIMRQASFLFVPTRQDCSPMVFPEANAYGIPAITTRTGGVPDVVADGVNGRLLPLDAGADAYADLIWSVWSDRCGYRRLRRSSRTRFEEALNWTRWLERAAPVIERSAL